MQKNLLSIQSSSNYLKCCIDQFYLNLKIREFINVIKGLSCALQLNLPINNSISIECL